jgi:hypothetical protein
MGSNSRYDRTAKVTGLEADEARALHVIADLLDDYPGIDAPAPVAIIVALTTPLFGRGTWWTLSAAWTASTRSCCR